MTAAVVVGLVPPGPVQTSENEALAASGPVLWVPLAAKGPLQLPDAVQAVALVEAQVKDEAPPVLTAVGLAARVAVAGTGALATATAAVTVGLAPPAPVQTSEYDVLADSGPTTLVPLAANGPVQPPEAVQAVAFVELQVNVVD